MTANYNSSNSTLVVAVANALANTTSRTFTFTPAGGPTSTGVNMLIMGVAGMTRTGSSAIRQTAKSENLANGATPSTTFSSAVLETNGTIVLTGLYGDAILPQSGWTFGSNLVTGDTSRQVAGWRNSGFSGTVHTWQDVISGVGGCAASLELDGSAP